MMMRWRKSTTRCNIFLLVYLVCSPFANAGVSCRQAFFHYPIGPFLVFGENFSRANILGRVDRETDYDSLGLIVHVDKTRLIHGLPPTNKSMWHKGLKHSKAYLDEIEHRLDFVEPTYKDRRGWGFTGHLRQAAQSLAPLTSSTSVFLSGRRVGSFAVVIAPYIAVGIEGPHNGGALKVNGRIHQTFDEQMAFMVVGPGTPIVPVVSDIGPGSVGFRGMGKTPHTPLEDNLSVMLPRPPMFKLGYRPGGGLPDVPYIPAYNDPTIDVLNPTFFYDYYFGVVVEPTSFVVDETLPPEIKKRVNQRLMLGYMKILADYRIEDSLYAPPGESHLQVNLLATPGQKIQKTYGTESSQRLYRLFYGLETIDDFEANFDGDVWKILSGDMRSFAEHYNKRFKQEDQAVGGQQNTVHGLHPVDAGFFEGVEFMSFDRSGKPSTSPLRGGD